MTLSFDWLLSGAQLLPGAACLMWRGDLVALHAAADVVTALAYFAIPVGVMWLAGWQRHFAARYRRLVRLFAAFILVGGLAYLVQVVALWLPVQDLQGLVKLATAVLAVAAVVALWRQLPDIGRVPASAQPADFNQRLRREVAAHEATLRELEAAHRDLEARVTDRTKELSLVKARFETALRGAQVYLVSQDKELRRVWAYSPRRDQALPAPDDEAVVAVKRRVLASGKPEDVEATYAMPEGPVVLAIHVEPTFDSDNNVEGIRCAALDITRMRALESEQRRLTEELSTVLQRYEMALRGSNVTVFTQDRQLRYTSISNPFMGREVADIIGRTDEEIIPEDGRATVIGLKQEVLDSGAPRDGEVRVGKGATARWFDLHIEPLHDVGGGIVGLTCAAVDITGRKEGEEHLRLLMRELTHRSKNLLAVIQAMARQTARQADTTESFLDRFSARLQAMARSHDLLVEEAWQGVSLEALIRSQLGHYLDRSDSQIAIRGPLVLLRPEAAQGLGLALHELAVNAARYGALSLPTGKVSIVWTREPPDAGSGVEIVWTESGGPAVAIPQQRGFGSLVIERNLARALEAEVDLEFAPDGVRCRIVVPITQLYGSS